MSPLTQDLNYRSACDDTQIDELMNTQTQGKHKLSTTKPVMTTAQPTVDDQVMLVACKRSASLSFISYISLIFALISCCVSSNCCRLVADEDSTCCSRCCNSVNCLRIFNFSSSTVYKSQQHIATQQSNMSTVCNSYVCDFCVMSSWKVILLRALCQNVNVLLSNITFTIFAVFDA